MKKSKILGIAGLICIIAIICLLIALVCISDKPNTEDPVSPVNPQNQEDPDEPNTPDIPDEPTDPTEPDKPDVPDNPEETEDPVEPQQTADPAGNENENEPTEPTDPQTPTEENTGEKSILDDPLLVLCNIDNPLPDGFSVDDLTTAQGKYQLSAVAAEAVKKMIAGAKKDGIELIICSAYRTISRQKELFNDKLKYYKNKGMSESEAYAKTATIIAVPGTSEHHTGLAADIVTPSYQTLDEGYMNTDAAKWLKAHCSEYGFILRYPSDKKDITKIIFEPWHFRYVGEYAQEITESGLCLEEWIEKVKSENR